MKTARQDVFWSVLVKDFSGKITYLATVRESSDGKKHLVGIRRLPTRITVLTDAVPIESLLADTPVR